MFVLWNTTEGNYLRQKDFNICKVNATSANSLEPAGASASAEATLNWFTPQYAGLALQAQTFYRQMGLSKNLVDFIPRIQVWGHFSGPKSNNWSRQFQSVDPVDNHNSWADTECNNIDQFVDI